MKGIVRAAVHNPMIVNLIMVIIMVVGLFYTINTRKEVFPALQMDFVNIVVPFPGASAEEVEEGVTIKIEEAIQGITGIDYVQSSSSDGFSSVSAILSTDVENPARSMSRFFNQRPAGSANAIVTTAGTALNRPIWKALAPMRTR